MSKTPTDSGTTDINEPDFQFHPHNVILMLLLFGITALFLALTLAFIYTQVQHRSAAVYMPPIFIVNTIVLLASSATLIAAKRAYRNDNTQGYQNMLLFTLILTVIFLVLQYFGWRALFSQDVLISSSTAASYLYVISGLHFAHVIAGIPFLLIFWITARRRMKEPVSVLVYFSDPDKRLKLRLLTLYWHFIDGLWIYLVVFFLINSLIR